MKRKSKRDQRVPKWAQCEVHGFFKGAKIRRCKRSASRVFRGMYVCPSHTR